MNAADYYGLEELRRACAGFVQCCINVDTVCALLASAERYIQYKCTKTLVQKVNLLPMNAANTRIPITSASFYFSFSKFIMSVIFQTIITSGEISRRFGNCNMSASSGISFTTLLLLGECYHTY